MHPSTVLTRCPPVGIAQCLQEEKVDTSVMCYIGEVI